MAEPKTRPTNASVAAFLAAIPDPVLRADCEAMSALMADVSKAPAVMWGTSIVGFGAYLAGPPGRRATWPIVGFAPRGKQLVLYVMPGAKGYDARLAALGPVKRGVACIYVKRLADLHQPTLKRLLAESVDHVRQQFETAG